MTQATYTTRYRYEGIVLEGTPEQIIEQVRKQFWFTPSTKTIFKFAAAASGRTVTNATQYIAAMVAIGVLKEEGNGTGGEVIRKGLVPYRAEAFVGGSGSYAGTGYCSTGDNNPAEFMNEAQTRAYCRRCATTEARSTEGN